MERIAVLYYSRTGNTRKVAKFIADHYSGRSIEIKDKKKRDGVSGYISGGQDAVKIKSTEIEIDGWEAKKYDTVFIGSPVWAGTMAPAIRTFLNEYDLSGKKLIFFCTTRKKDYGNIFADMEKLTNNPLKIKKIAIKEEEISKNHIIQKLKEII